MPSRPRIPGAIAALTLILPLMSPLGAAGQAKGGASPAKPAAAQPQEPGSRPSPFKGQAAPSRPQVTIPAGTQFSVRLGETLDTKKVHTGDKFSAILDSPVAVRGRTLIPA